MKKVIILFTILFAFLFTGCSSESIDDSDNGSNYREKLADTRRKKVAYLAYEHFFSIDTTDENLSIAYKKTIDACVNDDKYNCTILDSKISTGKYPSAHIKLRIIPTGMNNIVKTASSKGKIIQESTHVEDLAKPVVDIQIRLEMLENHRNRLIALQEKAINDIDALIKISSELSKIQSEIEHATGNQSFLLQRINMDIVNIDFRVELFRSFWRPIKESLSDFANNLSDGMSGAITTIAYLSPGIFILLILFITVRFIRKKIRKNNK